MAKGGDFMNSAVESARLYCDFKKNLSLFIAILTVIVIIFAIKYRFSPDIYSYSQGGGETIGTIKSSKIINTFQRNNRKLLSIDIDVDFKINDKNYNRTIYISDLDANSLNKYNDGNTVVLYYDKNNNVVINYTSPSTISNIIIGISLFILLICIWNYFILQTDIGCGFQIASNTSSLVKNIWSK
jgi:hypothetical protein